MATATTQLVDWAAQNHIDFDQIADAARRVADRLQADQAARVTLCPGDGTLYPLLVVPASCSIDMSDYHPDRDEGDIWIGLNQPMGRSYLWWPRYYEYGYVMEKWCPDSPWTAKILTLFFNALTDALRAK